MKKRLYIDGALGWGMLVLTVVFLKWPESYVFNGRITDNVLDAIGMIMVLKGCMFRLCARGHKREFPRWDLVTTGPYAVVRNPMYLGSFTIGLGYLLIAWPLWMIPIYAVGFYWRFNQEVKKEEEQLAGCHKDNYEAYCRKTPRVFPIYADAWKIKTRDVFNFEEILKTKDRWNLVLMPLGAMILDVIQEFRMFGGFDVMTSIGIFFVTIVIFYMMFAIAYKAH